MLTTKQIALIRNSYQAVAARSFEFSAVFYERLFSLQPALRLLFPDDLEAQKNKLLKMLSTAVRLIDAPQQLTPVLEESGRRHLLYGVRERDYKTVGAALLKTLAQTSGMNFDAETAAAWTRFYELMSEAMMRGAQELQNADDETMNLLAATIEPPFGGDYRKSEPVK